MGNYPRILVFIPAYRCEAQIVRVINQFDSYVQKWVDTVMVVDNCSPDRTLEAVLESGKAKLDDYNFLVLRNDDNYGLGGSHKVAFHYAIEQGFDYLIVLHGDDQADIHDLIPQLDAGSHERVDCLLGARFMCGSQLKGYSWFRTFGNYVYNLLFSLVVMHGVSDLGSGLNLYRVDSLKSFCYKSFPDDLTFSYVMLLANYYHKQTVHFFPITWREEDQISNVKLFNQAFKVLKFLVRYFFQRGFFLSSEMRDKIFDSYSGKIKFIQKVR